MTQRCHSQVLEFKLRPLAFELATNKTANEASLHTTHEVGEASPQQFIFVPLLEQFKRKLRFG